VVTFGFDRRWRLAILLALGASCTGRATVGCASTNDLEAAGVGPRAAQIASVLAASDEPLIRARPALAAGKYARMASSPYAFFRGSVPLARVDARSGTRDISLGSPSRFGLAAPLVPSLGDPHPENFGTLRASDGSFALEPNDLDSADRAPYLWDVRRFVTGMALAAALANADDPGARARASAEARAIARAGAVAYGDAVTRAARGEVLGRVSDGGSSVILADLLRRSSRDASRRAELASLTILEGGRRRFVRGAPDPEDGQNVLADLPAFARDALPDALAMYRRSLLVPVAEDELVVLDAVREHGSGVASWPRLRVLALVRGPSDAPDDDVLLEVKELADSQTSVTVPPFVYADGVERRVVDAARAAWARPDAEPWWGSTRWLGFPCQVRIETEAHKSLRVTRMQGPLGTPAALAELARALGTIVARVHTTDRRAPDLARERARAIAEVIEAAPEDFADEQADAGVALAQGALQDHVAFVHALRALGLRLGLPVSPEDAPRQDLALLYGTPPPPLPLPELP
jgi:uncharacterized protein (DUF2252 family)